MDAHERAQQVEGELVSLLYEQAPVGLSATILNASLVTFILWPNGNHTRLVTWLLLIGVITLCRFALVRQYQNSASTATQFHRWRTLFIIGAGAACASIWV